MHNFWNLVGFEFKKIIQRKVFWYSIIISILSIIVTIFASISGNSFYHRSGRDIFQYDAMKKDKAIIISNKGVINQEILLKAILANKQMVLNNDNYIINEYGKHLKSDAYIKYVLPYEAIVNLLNVVYENERDWLSMDSLGLSSVKPDKAIGNLTPNLVQNFDKDLKEFTKSMVLAREGLSTEEIVRNEEMIEQIKTPMYNDYYGGYEAYINSSKGLALIILFFILMILAPLFSNEYEERTDQLILSTKNGKNTLCKAKLFVSLTSSLVTSILIMGIALLCYLSIYGFEGGNINIQVVNPSCTYPLTLLEACTIHYVSVIIATLLFGTIIAFLSAKVKRRTFPVVVIGTVITILPMFIWIPLKSSRFLYNILCFFPINSVTFNFGMYFFKVCGVLFTPYKFIWIVSFVLIIALSYMAISSFTNHEVS